MTDRSGRTMRNRGDSATIRLNQTELARLRMLCQVVTDESQDEAPDWVILDAARDALNYLASIIWPGERRLVLPEDEWCNPACPHCHRTSDHHPEVYVTDDKGWDYFTQVCPPHVLDGAS